MIKFTYYEHDPEVEAHPVGAEDPDPEVGRQVPNRDGNDLGPGVGRPLRKVCPEKNGQDPDQDHHRRKRAKRRKSEKGAMKTKELL